MFYQESRTAKAAVIGTIMPWTGALSNIPEGWIICDGSTVPAREYPLLVQAIGDTYNAGTSNLGGAFPNYTGEFVLPDLNNRILMDIEESYFASTALGGTGDAKDTDTDARSIISPFIGDNTDNGVPVVFTNVYTDVVFTLNDRTGYSGRISGNTIVPGEGTRTVYIGGRKLGTSHIRSHSHSGSYETISNADPTRPGRGVVPYDNVNTFWYSASADTIPNLPGQQDTGARFFYQYRLDEGSWGDVENRSGFGNGSPGRVLARCRSEIPPVNLTPQRVLKTPIQNTLLSPGPQLDQGEVVSYAIGGNTITVPAGFRNYYPDIPGVGNFGTFVSNSADTWDDPQLQAHNHDPIDVEFDTNSLKPQSSITANANIPSTTVLDNATNIAALQIDMNTSQPAVVCIYLIRAY